MNLRRFALLFVCCTCSANLVVGQHLVELKGSSGWIRQESHLTPDQTKEKARQLAEINAIEKEFGTTVQQQTDMTINEGKDAFYIIGTTKVRGEWILTTREEFDTKTETNKAGFGNPDEVYIKCDIQGEGRKAPPVIDFKFQTMKCPGLSCQSETFQSYDQLYLFFRSPIDGFLTVFIEEEDSVRRLLPYSAMTGALNNCLPIRHDKDYYFFDKNQSAWPQTMTDEIWMVCRYKEKPERNTLWVIFSSEAFYKPGLSQGGKSSGLILPTALSTKNFHQWRADNSAQSPGFQSQNRSLIINPK